MSSLKKLSLWLVPLFVLGLFPVLLSAQDTMGKQSMSLTGCLKQGANAGDYYIMADGKMYEVMAGKGVSFAEHVGHTVTLAGHTVKLPAADEARKEASEKTEAGSSPYADFQVTSLKHISATCSQ
jgi:hypothetical protein